MVQVQELNSGLKQEPVKNKIIKTQDLTKYCGRGQQDCYL